MAQFVRVSKFRHVYADPPRSEQIFSDLRLGNATGDQQYIKTNGKYFAIAVNGGGGPFAVLPLDKPCRYNTTQPIYNGHTGAVIDFDFHPFNDQIIASCSDDQTIKLWEIPEEGLTENISEPLINLTGHHRRVIFLRFHPTAEGVLASAAKDNEIKLWDINTQSEIINNTKVQDLIQDIVWDYCGKQYAVASKNKKVTAFDARSSEETFQFNPHDGSKGVKLTYLGDNDKLLTVGFTKQSEREFKIWDQRNLDKPLTRIAMDQASGVILPFYDVDTSILYLAGKGDGNVRYYEISDQKPFAHPIGDYRSNVSAKGMAWIPKRRLNVMKCETARLLKLTPSTVEPLSFVVPRKAVEFQDDLYPDTFAPIPAMQASEWISGIDKPPVLMSLNPNKTKEGSRPSSLPTNMKLNAQTFKSPAILQNELNAKNAELEKANARIVELEQRLSDVEQRLSDATLNSGATDVEAKPSA